MRKIQRIKPRQQAVLTRFQRARCRRLRDADWCVTRVGDANQRRSEGDRGIVEWTFNVPWPHLLIIPSSLLPFHYKWIFFDCRKSKGNRIPPGIKSLSFSKVPLVILGHEYLFLRTQHSNFASSIIFVKAQLKSKIKVNCYEAEFLNKLLTCTCNEICNVVKNERKQCGKFEKSTFISKLKF